jgi:hypothetical protein
MHRLGLALGSRPGVSLSTGRGSSAAGHAAVTMLATVCRRGWLPVAPVLAVSMIAMSGHAAADDINDYPTVARADYVFGCMKANGETREILQKCSCSIDVIASLIPYDNYVATETILSMSQVTGPVGNEFRSTERAKQTLQEFRRAQAEAEVRCF